MKAIMSEQFGSISKISGSGGPFKSAQSTGAGGVDSSRLGTTAVSGRERVGSHDGSPMGKEGILEKELKTIQKIRDKQRKEVE